MILLLLALFLPAALIILIATRHPRTGWVRYPTTGWIQYPSTWWIRFSGVIMGALLFVALYPLQRSLVVEGEMARWFVIILFAPVTEEITKALAVLTALWFQQWIVKPADRMSEGFVVGLSFGLMENLMIFLSMLSNSEDISQGFILQRTFGPLVMHAVTGGLLGYFIQFTRPILFAVGGALVGLVIAAVIHTLWNGAAAIGLHSESARKIWAMLIAMAFVMVVVSMKERRN